MRLLFLAVREISFRLAGRGLGWIPKLGHVNVGSLCTAPNISCNRHRAILVHQNAIQGVQTLRQHKQGM